MNKAQILHAAPGVRVTNDQANVVTPRHALSLHTMRDWHSVNGMVSCAELLAIHYYIMPLTKIITIQQLGDTLSASQSPE